MRGWIALVGLLCCCWQATAETGSETSVALRRLSTGGLVVPVQIDDDAPRPFLIDTGASRTVLADDVALGLPPAGHAALATAGGVGVVARAQVTRVVVGGHAATDLTVLVAPRRALAAHGAVDGLLGLDVLARRAFTLDLRRRRLTWHDGAPAHLSGGTRVPLSVTRGRAVVTLAAPYDGAALTRLVLDSGATDLVVFGDSPLAARATPQGRVRLRGLMGERFAVAARLDALDVGLGSSPGFPAVIVERPAGWAGDEDGLLPLRSYAAILVDGPGRSVTLTPR